LKRLGKKKKKAGTDKFLVKVVNCAHTDKPQSNGGGYCGAGTRNIALAKKKGTAKLTELSSGTTMGEIAPKG